MNSQPTLEPANYYLLRRPLMPVNTFLALNKLVNTNNDVFEETLLNKYKHDPLFMEAIYTASPELYNELCKAVNNDAKPNQKLIITLYKYLSRMSTRCTPYGLFAGCSTGIIADKTKISYTDVTYKKQSRLDMNYVNELVNHLQLIPAIKKSLLYYVNSSLYSNGNYYRYIEYKVENKKRQYTLASVEKSEYLDLLIHAAANGTPYLNLIELLLNSDPEIEPGEAETFVDELIEVQLLISELEPTITGDVYIDKLVEKLNHKASPEVIAHLHKINSLLKEGGISAFEQIHQIINDAFVKCQSKDLIQTDLFYEHEHNQLKDSVTTQITAQLAELFKLPAQGAPNDLETFKANFAERYEDREIPLLQALDAESGVGYGAIKKSDNLPLLEGIVPKPKKQVKTTTWSAPNLLVNTLFKRAADSGANTVQLTEHDLEKLDDQTDLKTKTPSSLYAFGSIIASSAMELDNGNYLFALGACSGPSSANILGRFCHGDAKLYKNLIATLATDEPDTDEKVYAEIVHLPESRIGNILIRPHLRKYEIPFLGKSSKDAEHQIGVQDLMISIKNSKIVLRSRRLNKTVIPRLSTAHNYMTGLPVYRFLCDIQKDGLYHSIYWDWANLSDSRFLPRVEYKNIIVSKATWRVSKLALPNLSGNADTDIEYLNEYLSELQVPQYICITEHDNELLIDTSNYLGKKLLYQELTKKGAIKLTEFIFKPENCFIKGNDNEGFANEIVLPLSNKSSKAVIPSPVIQTTSKIQRTFIPGSEWIYLKMYGGTKTTEKVLVELLRPYLKHLVDEQIITSWFFIKYLDPDNHIRLRLKVPDRNPIEINKAISGLYELLGNDIEQHGLYKIQLDTYVRELERYGHNNIEYSEEWFYYDSLATINILNMLEGDTGETYRWLLAARGLDELLNDFGLNIESKSNLLTTLSNAFFAEFNGDKSLTLSLNEKFREHSKSIRSYLDPDQDIKNEISEATAEFKNRSRQTTETVKNIMLNFGGNLSFNTPGGVVLSSYIHMYINRFFLSEQRLHELVLYTLLSKYYISEQAINKKRVKI
jgi:thiopeptide-type bacteriocin biosynthesis protein